MVFFAAVAMAAEQPDEARPTEAQLTADRMRFDSQSGDFLATGNVVIRSGGLTIRAPRGTGNIDNKEVHFEEGIVASGSWQGDPVDLTAGSIALYLAQTPTYIAEKKVKGSVGKIVIDADKLYMKGPNISALNVRRLEDRETNVAFGGESAYGVFENGVLTSLTARRGVWVKGRPNADGEMVDIRGDTAVYSAERGSVVMSGNVRAVQKGRVLTSRSLVYFPDDNRIEAIGNVTESARITIDMSQEKQKQPEKGQ